VIEIVEEWATHNADAWSGRLLGQRVRIRIDGPIHACRIELVVACDSLKHQRRVSHVAAKWAHVVQRCRERKHSAHTDTTISRFQTHDTAERRRFADGAAG